MLSRIRKAGYGPAGPADNNTLVPSDNRVVGPRRDHLPHVLKSQGKPAD